MGLFNDTIEVLTSAESSFAEYAGAPASATWAKRLPVLDARLSLKQTRVNDGSLQARANESRPGYLGVRTAQLEIDVVACGHLSAPTGALTKTWLQDLLEDMLGGGDVTEVGGTITTSGTDADTLAYGGGATLLTGGMIRVGAKNDGRADGAATIVTAASGTPDELTVALPGTPANPDVLYAMQVAYPAETGHVTRRFLVGHKDTGAQWIVFGCQGSGLKLKSVIGDIAVWTLTYECAYWARYATTIPSANALEDCKAAIVAGGELYWQTVGTTTRASISPHEVEVDIRLGLIPKPGLGGQAYQQIVGWQRGKVGATLTLTLPWADTWETLFNTDGSDTTHKHALFEGNRDNTGKAWGIYFPRLYPSGEAPTRHNFNGMLTMRASFEAREGTDTTSELTRSLFRIGQG